jgi:DNA polymerase-3 subunit delta'
MSWQDIKGHAEVLEQFRRAMARGRLASTFLFVGPEGVGKRTFAVKLAQALLCSGDSAESLDPCGTCESCVQVTAGTHPDLHMVKKPKDRSYIPLETFIGDKQHRMQQGLCREIGLKPYMGGRKIAVIDDADHLNVEGANCLLKTLEEPPPRSVLILIGTSAERQLPTIRSRAQLIRFGPLAEADVAELLFSTGIVDDASRARELATRSGGSLATARQWADEELGRFRDALVRQWAGNWDAVRMAQSVNEFVTEAGKEASARRDRLRQVIGVGLQFFRQLLRELSGAGNCEAEIPAEVIRTATTNWRGDQETAAACIDRCLEALAYVDRNANLVTLVECWLDDLSAMATTGRAMTV